MVIALAELSRLISHALRHEPWLYELELDEEGWVDLDQLLDAIHSQGADWSHVDRDVIQTMIESSAKRRHELVGNRIRALYRHSLRGLIRKSPRVPPARLFHGTAPANVPAIKREGLKPMGRQYVHPSTNPELALQVGKRKDPHPLALLVDATSAHAAGITFYEGNELVWLAKWGPPAFITIEHHDVQGSA